MLKLSQLFEFQRSFDRKMGWNRYENCETPDDTVDFFEHFTLVMVDELGEISRVRKKFLRDKQPLDIPTLKKELVDIFIFVMQGSMALNMNLEEEYMQRMRQNKERFLKKRE
jgi:NTP pyrophosphatase (non-canonical NTP hydrolase)